MLLCHGVEEVREQLVAHASFTAEINDSQRQTR